MPRVELRGRELWTSIPEEIANALSINEGDAVSFEVLDNKLAGIRKADAMPPGEMEVLRKINQIRFAERTKERLRTVLTDDEQKILGKLVKKKIVQFYEQGKYKSKGVYSISKEYYAFLTTGKMPSKGIERIFNGKKYIVFPNFDVANKALGEMEKEIKEGKVLCVPGFDKKVYVTTPETMNLVGNKITSLLQEKDLDLKTIIESTGEEDDLIKTVLEILRESGEIIEKSDRVYSLV